jgi:hypothetical protein
MWPYIFLMVITLFTCSIAYDSIRRNEGKRLKVFWAIYAVVCNSSFLSYLVWPHKQFGAVERIGFGLAALMATALGLFVLKFTNLKTYALFELTIGLCSGVAACWSLSPDTPITLSQPVALFGSVYLLIRGLENGAKALNLLD